MIAFMVQAGAFAVSMLQNLPTDDYRAGQSALVVSPISLETLVSVAVSANVSQSQRTAIERLHEKYIAQWIDAVSQPHAITFSQHALSIWNIPNERTSDVDFEAWNKARVIFEQRLKQCDGDLINEILNVQTDEQQHAWERFARDRELRITLQLADAVALVPGREIVDFENLIARSSIALSPAVAETGIVDTVTATVRRPLDRLPKALHELRGEWQRQTAADPVDSDERSRRRLRIQRWQKNSTHVYDLLDRYQEEALKSTLQLAGVLGDSDADVLQSEMLGILYPSSLKEEAVLSKIMRHATFNCTGESLNRVQAVFNRWREGRETFRSKIIAGHRAALRRKVIGLGGMVSGPASEPEAVLPIIENEYQAFREEIWSSFKQALGDEQFRQMRAQVLEETKQGVATPPRLVPNKRKAQSLRMAFLPNWTESRYIAFLKRIQPQDLEDDAIRAGWTRCADQAHRAYSRLAKSDTLFEELWKKSAGTYFVWDQDDDVLRNAVLLEVKESILDAWQADDCLCQSAAALGLDDAEIARQARQAEWIPLISDSTCTRESLIAWCNVVRNAKIDSGARAKAVEILNTAMPELILAMRRHYLAGVEQMHWRCISELLDRVVLAERTKEAIEAEMKRLDGYRDDVGERLKIATAEMTHAQAAVSGFNQELLSTLQLATPDADQASFLSSYLFAAFPNLMDWYLECQALLERAGHTDESTLEEIARVNELMNQQITVDRAVDQLGRHYHEEQGTIMIVQRAQIQLLREALKSKLNVLPNHN